MNIHLKEPDQSEEDAGLQASVLAQSIGDEVLEVAWLSFIVATLSMAGVGLGVVLAFALDGYLV